MAPREIELDIRGQLCPSCLLLTLKTLNKHRKGVQNGEIQVRVLTDDRMAVTTIPEAVIKMGLEAQVEHVANGYRIQIRRAG